jgi:hypothetical protein
VNAVLRRPKYRYGVMSLKTWKMTPEELKEYISKLPKPPKKVRESELEITAPQKGFAGGKKYRRTGGEYR